MKYKINESQSKLIDSLKKRKSIKEQEFIMQSFSPTANEGVAQDTGNDWYTIEVSILTSPEFEHEVRGMNAQAFFEKAIEDAKIKIREAFNTAEFEIHSVTNKARGKAELVSNGLSRIVPA